MIKFNSKPVYICCGPTDMRKSINGLMILVKESFSLDPFMEALQPKTEQDKSGMGW